MKNLIKDNFIILVAFLLPIALIVIIALVTYLPAIFINTNYNFVYATCNEGEDYYPYQCGKYLQDKYSVVDGKLVVNNIDNKLYNESNNIKENYKARIFLHDTQKNESREITLEEAQTLTLNSLLTSPDGITISSSYDRGADFIFFFDRDNSYDYYLTKGRSRRKLNLINRDDRYYYRDNFQFIGWVLPQIN